MSLTIEAVYEDGVLKPAQPLPLKEHERVQVTLEPSAGWSGRTQGLLRWQGDADTLDRLTLDIELDPQESA